jgi:hypothetical protein
MADPLRYNISSWFQLPECKSNTSRDLHIVVNKIIDDGSHRLMGITIAVKHDHYGILFACLINAEGTLLIHDENSEIILEFNKDEILKILETFGFYVTFEVNQHLSDAQIDYLKTLDALGFDKLRMLEVQDKPDGRYSNYLVAFNVDKCPEWLKNDFTCGKKPFVDALMSSGAVNLTNLKQTEGFDWTWLTYVANIEDIIRDNNFAGDVIV